MRGTALTFVKQIKTGVDKMNNPVHSTVEMIVEDCLIAPNGEPGDAREQQGMQQSRDQVRIHLPKAFTADISNSEVLWGGKVFRVDSSAVVFMAENTPTRWNRYFHAEVVINYGAVADDAHLNDSYITEDATSFFITEDGYYYLEQEMIV